jgi:hypothetical protein
MAESTIAEAVWVKRLKGNRAGRLLGQHLASLDLQSRSKRRDCAVLEAIGNEKVFIHALARSLARGLPLPCGLSQPLPRFIAILNLSGERLLVYSDNPALVRCLCTQAARMQGAELREALTAFETFPMLAQTNSSRFVLLTYSLPWQAGTDAAFWHLSSCEATIAEDGLSSLLKDRIHHVSSVSNTVFKGKSVRDLTDATVLIGPDTESKPRMSLVTDEQITALTEDYSATNLDFEADECAESSAPAESQPGRREVVLNEIIGTLKQEQKQDRSEIRLLKDAKTAMETAMSLAMEACDTNQKEKDTAHARELESQRNTAKDMLEASRLQNDAFAAEIVALKKDKQQLSAEKQEKIKENKKLTEKQKDTARKSDAKDALHNAALSQHVATISRLEGEVATKDERIKTTRLELEKQHNAALAKMKREHEEAIERLTGALESKKRIINQLSENNDRKDVEKDSLQTHTDEQAARILVLESELASKTDQVAVLLAEAQKAAAVAAATAAAAAAAPKTRNKSVGTYSRNASTATHHCASTQTAPSPPLTPPPPSPSPVPPPSTPSPQPEPVLASAVGAQIVAVDSGTGQQVPSSYQAAIDMLQELVNASCQGGTGTAQTGVAVPAMPSSYTQPLPFPHFNPVGVYAPTGQFHQPHQPYNMPQPPPHAHAHAHAYHPHHHHHHAHAHAKGYARS